LHNQKTKSPHSRPKLEFESQWGFNKISADICGDFLSCFASKNHSMGFIILRHFDQYKEYLARRIPLLLSPYLKGKRRIVEE
jgi:hypothetical protein